MKSLAISPDTTLHPKLEVSAFLAVPSSPKLFLISPLLITMAVQKTATTNGAPAKAKVAPASTNGTATPVEKHEHDDVATSGRPDKKVFDAEQDKIKHEIDALQTKLASSHVFALLTVYGLTRLSSPRCETRSLWRRNLVLETTDEMLFVLN